MPRKTLIRSSFHPYHVTGVSNNHEGFHCSQEVAWDIFTDKLHEITDRYQAKVHAFILMPDHFQLLISTPDADLGTIMQNFIASVTKATNRHSGRINRVFGKRYHWSLIRNPEHFPHILKYVFQTPVRAQLSSKVEDYYFSTLNSAPELRSLPISLARLNQPLKSNQEEAIRKGLTRTIFLPAAKSNWKRERVKLE